MKSAALSHAYSLKVLSVHPDYTLQSSVIEFLRKNWFNIDAELHHDIAVGLLRSGQFEMALESLDYMHSHRVHITEWLYDLAIYTLGSAGELNEAIALLKQRVADGTGHTVSAAIWSWILDACSSVLHYEGVRYVWMQRVRREYLNPPSGTCLNALHCAARTGDVDLATDVLRVLGNRGIVFDHEVYELAIETYLNASPPDLSTAMHILCTMNEAKVYPDSGSTRAILQYLQKDPALLTIGSDALRMLSQPHEGEQPMPVCEVPVCAGNVLIEASLAHNNTAFALELYQEFDKLVPSGADAETYNLFLKFFAEQGRKDLAVNMAREMVAHKVEPNEQTYNAMILACLPPRAKFTPAKQWKSACQDALNYYDEARSHNIWPHADVLQKLVQTLDEYGDARRIGIMVAINSADMRTAHQGMRSHRPRAPRGRAR